MVTGQKIHALMKAFQRIPRADRPMEDEYSGFIEALNIFQQKYDYFMTDEEFDEGYKHFVGVYGILLKVEERRAADKVLRRFNPDTKKWEDVL